MTASRDTSGNATAGLEAVGTYVAGDMDGNLAELLRVIPDPDAAPGTGAVAGGGFLDEMSPGCAAQLRVEIDSMGGGSTSAEKDFASGSYTVTAGDVTATYAAITTGLSDLTLASCAVSIFRSGTLTGKPTLSETPAGTLKIETNGSVYVLTAGDIVNYMARR